ncbi:DNA-binding protein [Actinomadura sp. KC216]|nr:DNA-binding protein [Actinomadura sp. KC216]
MSVWRIRPMTCDPLMTLQETADYLHMSRSWVYERIHSIPNFKVGGKRLFRKSEVDKWLEAFRKGSPLALL